MRWDPKRAFCSVGDPTRLRVIIPVEPSDFSLLAENMGAGPDKKSLAASVRVSGMGRSTWRGEVRTLPEAQADQIPLLLSNKTNGPVAVKPSGDPNQLVPQTQQYLVQVALPDVGRAVSPGVRAKVKIHCRKRTVAWWVWRSIHDTFNL